MAWEYALVVGLLVAVHVVASTMAVRRQFERVHVAFQAENGVS